MSLIYFSDRVWWKFQNIFHCVGVTPLAYVYIDVESQRGFRDAWSRIKHKSFSCVAGTRGRSRVLPIVGMVGVQRYYESLIQNPLCFHYQFPICAPREGKMHREKEGIERERVKKKGREMQEWNRKRKIKRENWKEWNAGLDEYRGYICTSCTGSTGSLSAFLSTSFHLPVLLSPLHPVEKYATEILQALF